MKGVLIIDNRQIDIPLGEMLDGQIGRITRWWSGCVGAVVQRYGDALVVIGRARGEGWLGAFAGCLPLYPNDYRIQILPPGTQIEIL